MYLCDRISETSIETFIIRVYRDKNRTGFIKAFTDEPETLINTFNKAERLLKLLYITKLYLWPRFQVTVAEVLDRNQPTVIEATQPLTENMKIIQSSIIVAMNSCIIELKRLNPQLDTTTITLENGLFRNSDYSIKVQLDPEWHRLTQRTKQLVSDMSQLRMLLDYLLRYDCYTFYSFLMSLQSASSLQQCPSLWYGVCVYMCIHSMYRCMY